MVANFDFVKSDKILVLFDGVCNLCNGAVRFIYHRDKNDTFRYLSLQSDEAKQALQPFGYNFEENNLNSFVVLKDGELYTKSSAALQVAASLGFPYNLAGIFTIVPKVIRDGVYNAVARNRYKWFGKRDEVCEFDPEFESKNQWKK